MGYSLGIDIGTTFTAAAINREGRLRSLRWVPIVRRFLPLCFFGRMAPF